MDRLTRTRDIANALINKHQLTDKHLIKLNNMPEKVFQALIRTMKILDVDELLSYYTSADDSINDYERFISMSHPEKLALQLASMTILQNASSIPYLDLLLDKIVFTSKL